MSEEIKNVRRKLNLILVSVRNLLDQRNKSGVNDYLINQIDREMGL